MTRLCIEWPIHFRLLYVPRSDVLRMLEAVTLKLDLLSDLEFVVSVQMFRKKMNCDYLPWSVTIFVSLSDRSNESKILSTLGRMLTPLCW